MAVRSKSRGYAARANGARWHVVRGGRNACAVLVSAVVGRGAGFDVVARWLKVSKEEVVASRRWFRMRRSRRTSHRTGGGPRSAVPRGHGDCQRSSPRFMPDHAVATELRK